MLDEFSYFGISKADAEKLNYIGKRLSLELD